MKTRIALTTAALVALAAVSTATAGPPNKATVELLGVPTAGQTLNVRFEVFGTTPVVPYEYAIQNMCTSKNGNFTVGQRDDIVYWEDVEASGIPDGNPDVIVPVYLQSIPEGWKCKVALIRNNTVVKGSAALYTVV